MADTTPLWNLLNKAITQEMLDAIAAEHEKGRILLVGTTNLDARRPVVWNITRDRGDPTPRRARARAQDPARLGRDPGHVSSRHDRRRSGREVLRGDARGRRDGGAGLRLPGRHAAGRPGRGARRRARALALRHPQRAPGSGMGEGGPPDAADRHAGHQLPHPVPGHRRPVPHLHDHAARRRGLQPRATSPRRSRRRTRQISTPHTWNSSSTSDTGWPSRARKWAKEPPILVSTEDDDSDTTGP